MIFEKIKQIFNLQIILLLFVLAITFISYIQITNFEFIQWDDDAQITKNAYVKNLNQHTISHNFDKDKFTFFTLTTFSVIYKIWGNNPAPFHWLSLFLHLINIILIFQLVKQFSKNLYTISFVVLLFALHPMRVESVAWISELKGLLSTFFSLISFLLYFKYIKSKFKFYYFLLAILMIILASFSKINGLIIPILFILIDIFLKREFTIEMILEKFLIFFILILLFFSIFKIGTISFIIIISTFYLIFAKTSIKEKLFNFKKNKKLFLLIIFITCLLGLYFIFKNLYSNQLSIWYESRYSFSLTERLLLAGYALWFYLSNLIFPYTLNAIHPYPTRLPNGMFPNEYYLTIIVLFLIIVLSIFLIIKHKKISKFIFFGWFFFLVNISLVLHIIPIEGRIVVADRYSYLAYFGLFLFVSAIFEKLNNKSIIIKRIYICFFIILLGTLSLITYNRCSVWANTHYLFTDVLQKNPKVSFAYTNLAATQMNKKEYSSAIISFNKAIEIDSLDSYAYFNRAFTFIEKGDDNKAIEDFKTAIRINNNSKFRALSYTHIGEIYKKLNQDSLAIYYFDLAINTDNELSFPFNKRGVYYLEKNNNERALSDFNKAIELDAYSAEAINNLGSVLLTQGKSNDALEYFNKAIEIEPEYSISYFNRGFLKYNNGDPSSSIKDFDKAIELNKDFYQAYIQRGRVNAYLGNYKNAINDFTFVLNKESNNMTALTNRAYAFYYLNDIINAEIDFLKATELFPDAPFCWQNLGWFYFKTNNYNKAITSYKKSLEIDSNQIISLINLGNIYIEIKDFNKAETYLQKSLVINPGNSESLYLLGDLYRKKGNKEKSCEYYNKSLLLGNKQATNALNIYCK